MVTPSTSQHQFDRRRILGIKVTESLKKAHPNTEDYGVRLIKIERVCSVELKPVFTFKRQVGELLHVGHAIVNINFLDAPVLSLEHKEDAKQA